MPNNQPARVGGSFAPPLDAAKLTIYRALANQASGAVGEYMLKLCDMLDHFWQTPRSKLQGLPHPSGVGTIIPLEDAEIKRIWDHVPWVHECDMMGKIFDSIDPITKKNLRDAAFHLLWFAKELELDREPITNNLI